MSHQAVRPERLIGEFLELVQVDSVSGKERQIADLLIRKLADLGLEVREDGAGIEAGSNSGNVIGWLPGTGKGPVIMLCSHMDTVEPGIGVKPVLKNGVIRSAGNTVLGADDKAGIATILEVLRIIRELRLEHGGLEIIFTIREEDGLYGAKNLKYHQLKACCGFVLDSDGAPGTIVNRAPSQDRIVITIRGKAAHAGLNPEDGINAIKVASEAIAQMKLGRIDHETTCNIGIISGGRAANIVPESVTIQGEARSLNRSKRETQTARMCQAVSEAAENYKAGADITVETIYNDFHLGEESPPVKIAQEAAFRLGLKPALEKTGGGSDANIFNQMGIPTVVLGVGMKKAHTCDEYITTADLVNNARYLLEIILVAQGRNF
ncbi:MAG: Carboxypeptidase G2 precursor [Firmicutes bacterium ADurb.Bin456]|nr:MAG: Carboxypeptidase G2 precursor [Firmicutes bacterium ADurb.Bin456]